MKQQLHVVFGGELEDPSKMVFRDVTKIHTVGIFPNYELAFAAWKAEAQRTVDNAHTRYFIANLAKLKENQGGASWQDEAH